jgi:hypothetical protein
MPGVETGDVKLLRAQFVHEPWRHRPGLEPDLGIAPRMPPDCTRNLSRVGCALATPKPAASVVDNANRSQLL